MHPASRARFAAALDYAKRYLQSARKDLSLREIDEAEGRIVRLQRLQSDATTQPSAQTEPQKVPRPTGWRAPAGALALLAGGSGSLIAGLACGGAALSTGAQLRSGQAFTLREIDTLSSRGEALNAAAIALDTLGGVAIAAGATWLIVDFLRSRARPASKLAPEGQPSAPLPSASPANLTSAPSPLPP